MMMVTKAQFEEELKKAGIPEADLGDKTAINEDQPLKYDVNEELSEEALENVSGGSITFACALLTAGVTLIGFGVNWMIKEWDYKHQKVEVCTTSKNGLTKTCTVSYKKLP